MRLLTKSNNEHSFVSKINKKEIEAYKELYNKYYSPLCSYASRIVDSEDIAEDIVQECLLKLWESPLTFENINMLSSWLYRVTYTKSLNKLRERKNAQNLLKTYTDSGINQEEDWPIELAIEEMVIQELREAIEKLPPQQHTIIQLTLSGLKVKEIANKLCISENTVKIQKKRAYHSLRTEIGKQIIDHNPTMDKYEELIKERVMLLILSPSLLQYDPITLLT